MRTIEIHELEQINGGALPLVIGAAKVIGYAGGSMGIASFLMELF